ncbi:MAG: HAD-IA family hydrolase [Coriobacteriia bacterium]|nr:HAD-IA family hydrolase [Coriobacteriia bacterium]MBN2841037.1 HAD-IA family hydrolase [Coriobacteriia bacterium]
MKIREPLPAAIDAVLFDLDGTVVDTIPHILASFRHATADVLGAALPDDELMHHVGIPLAHQMRIFTTDEGTVEQLLASYREYNHRTHDEMARLYPNTVSALEILHGAGVSMGIVTSKSRTMADRAISLFGLGQYFGAVVTADDTQVHKPDPMPVIIGAEMLGVSPVRAVYVGDSPMDIEAGNSAGAYTIAATWGVASRERLQAASPGAIIDDIAELPSLLGVGS